MCWVWNKNIVFIDKKSVNLQLRDDFHALARAKLLFLHIRLAQTPCSTTYCLSWISLWRWRFFVLILTAYRFDIWQLLDVKTVVHLHKSKLALFLSNKIEICTDFLKNFVNDFFIHSAEHAWHGFKHTPWCDLINLGKLHIKAHNHANKCQDYIRVA